LTVRAALIYDSAHPDDLIVLVTTVRRETKPDIRRIVRWYLGRWNAQEKTVLVYIVLAKLSGENFVRGMADWVKLRKEQLAEGLGLAKVQAPHATTYTRILGHAIDPDEFQRVVGDYFAHLPQAGISIAINLDGKTVRRTQ
jgi:hypothetical protein